jgi:tape measure domain-containing protein
MATNKTLVQRIALDGGEEIRRELLALGKAGEQAFAALSRQAAASKASTTGLNADLLELRNRLNAVGTAARQFGSNFRFLGGAVGQLGGALATVFSAQAFINITSLWTDLNSRIKLVVGTGGDAANTMQRLADVARNTYSPLERTVDSFARNAVVLKELGVSTERQLDVQESINNALVVSGVRGQKAEQVQNSLTKAFSLGALRGEELNNVLTYGSRIAQLLADHFGTTTGGLRKLSEQGLITGDVLQEVLVKNLGALREEAAAMPATIADGFILIQNALLQYIGAGSEATGVSTAIADGLIWIADNIDIVVPALLSLVGAFGLVKAVGLAKDLFGIGKELLALIPILAKLTLVLLTNPFGLAAAAVGAFVAVLIIASGGLDKFLANVIAVAKSAADALWPLVEPVLGFVNAVIGAIKVLLQWLGLTAPEEAAKAEEALASAESTAAGLGATFKAAGVESADMSTTTVSGMAAVEAAVGKADRRIQRLEGTFQSLSYAVSGAAENAARLYEQLAAVGGASGSFQTAGITNTGSNSSIQGLAGGGPVRGAGTGTSDSILARLSNGEFVMRARAVRKWGVNALARLNRGLPAFASGGLVSMPRMGTPVPAFSPSGGGSNGRPLSLSIGGETFDGLIAPDTVAEKLVRFATGKAVRRSGSTPSWYK